MADAKRSLDKEIEAARILRENYADLIEGDEGFAADLVEGETNLNEMIGVAIEQIALDQAAIDGISEFIKRMEARKNRHEKRVEALKTAVLVGLQQAERKTLPHALATLTVRSASQSAIITDESLIPSKFWKKQPPKLDKKAILDALKNKEKVDGATLSNGGETLSMRFK